MNCIRCLDSTITASKSSLKCDKIDSQCDLSPDSCFLLMMELIEVLHVSKDDVLLVDDSWRNLLNSTGHFPQIGLQREKEEMGDTPKFFIRVLKHSLCEKLLHNSGMKRVNIGGLWSWTYVHALPQVSHVSFFCLNQLCHYEPRHTQAKEQNQPWSYFLITEW